MQIRKLFIFIIFIFTLSCDFSDPELYDLVLSIKTQNDQLLAEVKSLKAQSDILIEELKISTAKQTELLAKVNELQVQLSSVIVKINQLSTQLQTQGADLTSIKAQLDDLQKKYEGILKQLEQLQQLSKILAEIEILKATIAGLVSNSAVILNSLTENQNQLDAIKVQIAAIQVKLNENFTSISQLISQLTQQGVNINQILLQIAELKKANEELKAMLENLLAQPQYPLGSVFGPSGPTIIVEVTNPKTGKTWMDRNLGASRAAISSTDAASYGDLYQWGRRADGHQLRNSTTTTSLSSSDQPGNGNFILAPGGSSDWRSPQNVNLWQGVGGVNNPCPTGYRLPTETELSQERLSWNTTTSAGAFASPLKWPVTGYRLNGTGLLNIVGTYGTAWTSTVTGTKSSTLGFTSNSSTMGSGDVRADGRPVRCIKN